MSEHGLLHDHALTVNGKTIGENVKNAPCWNDEVIRPWDRPVVAEGGIVVLRGNLAPDGAVLKPSAASPHLLRHTGRAVVFETIEHYRARIEDPALEVDENSVLVLKNCGPKGYPGMAEVGNMGLPPKLLKRGITDMVRISDARMSGTAYGTVVLHVAPEAAVGGPLALVRDGDRIALDVPARRLELHVPEEELRGGARCGHRRLPPCTRAIGSSSTTMCCRPTAAVISISSWAAGVPRCRATATDATASASDPREHRCEEIKDKKPTQRSR